MRYIRSIKSESLTVGAGQLLRAALSPGGGGAMPESLKKTMELLAPAGDEASLRAAVCAGANAVYLGFSRFGARASAANFDAEMLEKAVAYAHLYHVRIHVTVNTLVKPQETADIRTFIVMQ